MELWAAVYKFLRVTLWHMSIGAGVVRAVALQQIHHAPHAKASAEGNNQRLQSVDGRRKELHIASISPGIPGHEKSRPYRRRLPHLGTICPEVLFIQRRPGHRDRHS